MKKKCMIYGNCQHTHLESFLEQSAFSKYFEFIKVKDVYIRDKTFLDDETLLSLDCFIYQHVSNDFDAFFATDSICSKLRSDCIRIAIPNFWCGAYFPQHCRNPIIRPNKKYSIAPSGIFPYGDININSLLSSGINENNIIKILSDPDYYDANTIEANIQKTFNDLEGREKNFGITIPSVSWLRNNFCKKQICVTVNHPTHSYFAWLADSIINLFDIHADSCESIPIFPFSRKHIHVPIYPSVVKHLNLQFIGDNQKYKFYNELYTFEQYIKTYIKHATGKNIYGKDSIKINDVKKIFTGEVKLLPCSQTEKRQKELKTIFCGYDKYTPDKNTILWGDKTIIVDTNTSYKEIPGVEIKFDGTGNLIFIHNEASFTRSFIRVHNNCYIRIGKSRFGKLFISNASHDGGICIIGDKCIAGEGLKIHLYGNNTCTIGNGCIFADGVKIMCSDGHTLFDQDQNILNQNDKIQIGNHVWIAYNVTILKGTIVSDNSMIGAGSLIDKKFTEPGLVIAGIPARCIRKDTQWLIKNPEDF